MSVILPKDIITPNIAVPLAIDSPNPLYTTREVAYEDLSPKIYFYVPTEEGDKKLQIRYSGKTSNVTWFARLNIDNSTNSAGVSGISTSFEDKFETHDASLLKVGWHYIRLQAKNNGLETTTIENWTVALSA